MASPLQIRPCEAGLAWGVGGCWSLSSAPLRKLPTTSAITEAEDESSVGEQSQAVMVALNGWSGGGSYYLSPMLVPWRPCGNAGYVWQGTGRGEGLAMPPSAALALRRAGGLGFRSMPVQPWW